MRTFDPGTFPERYSDEQWRTVRSWWTDDRSHAIVENIWFNDSMKKMAALHPEHDWGRDFPYYCGYVRFPARPIRSDSEGMLRYVPVSGGITYDNLQDDGTMIYGFDCNHAGDDVRKDELGNLDWLQEHTTNMGRWITTLARYELGYLEADTNEAKAAVIEAYLADIGQPFNLNFGTMLPILFGEL